MILVLLVICIFFWGATIFSMFMMMNKQWFIAIFTAINQSIVLFDHHYMMTTRLMILSRHRHYHHSYCRYIGLLIFFSYCFNWYIEPNFFLSFFSMSIFQIIIDVLRRKNLFYFFPMHLLFYVFHSSMAVSSFFSHILRK